MIWFTSDTHWGHKLMVAHRGYESAEAMDRDLIERWNARVQPGDVVYHLGDVSFRSPQQTQAIARRLHGQVFLIPGNHDKRATLQALEAAGWCFPRMYTEARAPDVTRTGYVLEVAALGRRLVLSHYALATWPGAHRGAWHLHGHSHGNLHGGDERTTRTDVGVDGIWGPGPVNLERLTAVLGKRRYRPVDHHRKAV